MPVESLKCPMCGAPATPDSTSCSHCGARLATVSCPVCFAAMFIGQQYCPHCGARADRKDGSGMAPNTPCPRCKSPMEAVVIGGNNLLECPKCEGIWTDAETLRQICANREQQSAVLGMASHLPPDTGAGIEKQIRYLPCPVCGELMNRVNFANFSNVIVEVCQQHGTWFDHDELRRIVEFIRDGGLDKARAREIANLEEDRRLAALGNRNSMPEMSPDPLDPLKGSAIYEVAQSVIDLFIRH